MEEKIIFGNSPNFIALHSDDHVFKFIYGFAEGGEFEEDLCWSDYDDLYLYSKREHNGIKYDLACGNSIVIMEIWKYIYKSLDLRSSNNVNSKSEIQKV